MLCGLFLLRRLLFGIIIVFGKAASSTGQIALLIICSCVLIWFQIRIKPMKKESNSNIEVFNEICFLVCVNLCILFSDIVPDPTTRYKCGWLFLAVVTINLLGNWILMVRDIVKKLKKKRTKMTKKHIIKDKKDKKDKGDKKDKSAKVAPETPFEKADGKLDTIKELEELEELEEIEGNDKP
jgi:hypothetical protein